MAKQNKSGRLQVTETLWIRVPLSSKAFLSVGVLSIFYLLLPAERPALLVLVYLSGACAGVLSFQDVMARRRQPHHSIRLSPTALVVLRTLELVSITAGLFIMMAP